MSMLFSKIEIDRRVSEYFANSKNRRLNKTFAVLTHLGDGALWLTIYALIFFFLYDRYTRMLYALVSAEIIGLSLIISLRYITKRRRPDRNYTSIIPWNKYSFPSHHSLRTFLIATIIGIYSPHLLPFLLSVAVVVSFSRIYLLKHYLSDVFAGALLGFLTANISLRLF
jgi:undecaprenyl-diphosphatase